MLYTVFRLIYGDDYILWWLNSKLVFIKCIGKNSKEADTNLFVFLR